MNGLQNILSRFPEARTAGTGWSARCPAHEDTVSSLSISEGDDGRVLLHCHAGCSLEQICDALGINVADLFSAAQTEPSTLSTSTEPTKSPGNERLCRRRRVDNRRNTFATPESAIETLARSADMTPVDSWSYHDIDGSEVLRVVRLEQAGGKTFRPISRTDGGWKIGDPSGLLPLYRLPELQTAERVLVVEGEKAAEAARAIGYTATTSAHGAKSPKKADWSPLAGREVIILPDNDDAGFTYADQVAELLGHLNPVPEVRILELPDLPEHGDLVEFVEDHEDEVSARLAMDELVKEVEEEAFVYCGPDVPPFKPFPLEALPAPVGEFAAIAAEAISCDPSFVAVPLLSVFAAAIGNTRQIQLKRGWVEPSIIWTVIVANSGVRKTPPFKLATKPLKERQRRALDRYEKEMAEFYGETLVYNRDLNDWKKHKLEERPDPPQQPLLQRFVTSDTTVEALAPILRENPRGVLTQRDELVGWFGSFDRYAQGRGSDMSNWLSMHNAETIIVDRKTGVPPVIYVHHASVSVTGGIQPGILGHALTSEARDSGLAARLLLAWPPKPRRRWTDKEIRHGQEEVIAELVDRLIELEPLQCADGREMPIRLRMTDEARDVWIQFYNEHAEEEEDLDDDLAAAWAKLEGYAARISLVIHLVRWAAQDETLEDSEWIDASSVRSGIAICRWFCREARRIYAMLGESDEDHEHRQLVEWITRRGGRVTARQLQQGRRDVATAEAARLLLQTLVDRGVGQWVDLPQSRRGGRPAQEFVLNGTQSCLHNPSKPAEIEGSVDVDTVDAVENAWGEL